MKHQWLAVPGKQPTPGLMLAVSGTWFCTACKMEIHRPYLSDPLSGLNPMLSTSCPGVPTV